MRRLFLFDGLIIAQDRLLIVTNAVTDWCLLQVFQRVSKNSLLSTKNTKKKAKNFVFLRVLRGFYPGQTQVLPIFRQPVSKTILPASSNSSPSLKIQGGVGVSLRPISGKKVTGMTGGAAAGPLPPPKDEVTGGGEGDSGEALSSPSSEGGGAGASLKSTSSLSIKSSVDCAALNWSSSRSA